MANTRVYTGITEVVFSTIQAALEEIEIEIRVTPEDERWFRVYSGIAAVTIDLVLGDNDSMTLTIRDRKPFFLSEDMIWEYADAGVISAGGSIPG